MLVPRARSLAGESAQPAPALARPFLALALLGSTTSAAPQQQPNCITPQPCAGLPPGDCGCWEGPWNWKCQFGALTCAHSNNHHPEFSLAALIPKGPYRGWVMLEREDCSITGRTLAVWLFNPASPEKLYRVPQELFSDLFCSGLTWDPDGDLVVAGGAPWKGTGGTNWPTPKLSYRFQPEALQYPPVIVPCDELVPAGCCPHEIQGDPWTPPMNMSVPRYYPSVLTLQTETIPPSPGSAYAAIPGGSSFVIGGAPDPGGPYFDDGNEYWQCLPSSSAVPGNPNPAWLQTFVPDSTNYGNHPSFQLPPTTESYTRRVLNGPALALPSPPHVVLDSFPHVYQLNTIGVPPNAYTRNIYVAFDIDTNINSGGFSPQGLSWVVRPPYLGGSATTVGWELHPSVHMSFGMGTSSFDRVYGGTTLMHMKTQNQPHSNGKNRILAFGGTQDLNPVLTCNGQLCNYGVCAQQHNWQVNTTVQEYVPGADPETGGWVVKGPQQTPRLYGNVVSLPTGDILITGGGTNVTPCSGQVTSFQTRPELYDPGAAGQPNSGSSIRLLAVPPDIPVLGKPFDRVYHNLAVLLPDGRVLTVGGQRPGGEGDPNDADWPGLSGEILSPPYLGYGFQPNIRWLSADSVRLSDTTTQRKFQVDINHTIAESPSPQTGIVGFVLLRPAAVTHQNDTDQRYIELDFVQLTTVAMPGTERFEVTSPMDDLGPPGYYMLFAIEQDSQGHKAPCKTAKFMRFY